MGFVCAIEKRGEGLKPLDAIVSLQQLLGYPQTSFSSATLSNNNKKQAEVSIASVQIPVCWQAQD